MSMRAAGWAAELADRGSCRGAATVRGSAAPRSRSAKASFFASTHTWKASPPNSREIEMLEDLQCLEKYKTGRVGWGLEHGKAAVVDCDRQLPLGFERREIIGRDQRPGRLEIPGQPPCQRAAVERLGTLRGDL